MDQECWSEVDRYIEKKLVGSDAALTNALAAATAAQLPSIEVSPNHGKLLGLVAGIHNSRRILELGTLAGYSTIWLARALPADGRLITIESNASHARIAQANIEKAGVGSKVEIRVGKALELFPELLAEGLAPFDFIFIDADKESYPEYYEWAVRVSQYGTVIVIDNVVRNGAIREVKPEDKRVKAVKRLFDLISQDHRVSATAVQTVGTKGYDGFVLARVTEDLHDKLEHHLHRRD
ncbi:MAG: O-methyltransferase [Verrucomicrobia bacterium]|nr:O-methyltransferase [Verrucomicrobiota bacterium]MBV8970647.1 O-methyltransferase [Verrucomicrobiota bacterium]